MIYKNAIWPVLSQVDAETTHDQTLTALSLAQSTFSGRFSLRRIRGNIPNTPVDAFGLRFPNVIGMAAGFDKDVRVARGLFELGFGHVEVGTLTPRPQIGNEKPRIFRLKEDQALINRMGFPNGGVDGAIPRLKKLASIQDRGIIGVSLGKQKETPLDEAVGDYVEVLHKVYEYADYLAVNVSSPNTPGLRKLQGKAFLDDLLGSLQAENKGKPLLLKIAPDLEWGELDLILDSAESHQISAIIATNTTIERQNLQSKNAVEKGGLSGDPVRQKSTAVVKYIAEKSNLPVIGVGGIRTADHVREKLDAGAVLVQTYTGLVYEGPSMIGNILREL